MVIIEKIKDYSLLICFSFFLLFDNYINLFHIRPFDLFGVLLCFIFLVTARDSNRLFVLKNAQKNFVILVSAYLLISYLFCEGKFRPTIGIMLGVFTFCVFYTLPFYREKWIKFLNVTLIFFSALIFAQYLWFFITSKYLFPVVFPDSYVRVWWRENGIKEYLRPAGLYMEPNDYALSLFMLLSLREYIRKTTFDLILYLSIFTMLICFSLYGIIISYGFFCYGMLVRAKSVKKILMTILVLLLLPYLFGSSINKLQRLEPKSYVIRAFNTMLVERIGKVFYTIGNQPGEAAAVIPADKEAATINLSEVEASYTSRYGGLLEFFSQIHDIHSWVGHGVNTAAFQGKWGANGISLILYTFGLIGCCIIFTSLLVALDFQIVPLILIGISLLAYPLLTYMIWWAWLALLMKARIRPEIGIKDMVDADFGTQRLLDTAK